MGNKSDNYQTIEASKVGLYVLAAKDIFALLRHAQFSSYQVFVSCFEIYGGKLFDLLNDRSVVKCLEDSKQQVQILGLTDHVVKKVEELVELMQVAHNVRSTGATGANAESSRSHLIMQIEIKTQPKPVSSQSARRQSFLNPHGSNVPKMVSVCVCQLWISGSDPVCE